jgi:hypothetical protein
MAAFFFRFLGGVPRTHCCCAAKIASATYNELMLPTGHLTAAAGVIVAPAVAERGQGTAMARAARSLVPPAPSQTATLAEGVGHVR